ncbi:unnamed protein product [Parascedosporium putredinis]|uniref:ER membrane protein complex subunit 1 n=1 Tax=Parascedosporium putredinis TaxID=1442378 RepID=A0A9P1GUY9_9PEZI|nr:unnamed protein product [Parascedosporium putredinis]CAI7988129.1 unnamed protein product [Parascedosporium putredinis]
MERISPFSTELDFVDLDVDFHYNLLGVPQSSTTLFHKPRKVEKASLLYTLSDIGVLGARGGFLRAGDGQSWLCSAYGNSVHAWDAFTGRNTWWMDFAGEIKDLEILEVTEDGRKDVLVLFEEAGSTVVRRLRGDSGQVVWEASDSGKDIPLQVSTNIESVYSVSLHDVTFVGSNSAAPIIAWTDASVSKLRVNVIGTKNKLEFPLAPDAVSVDVHAPHQVQSNPHFLVHTRTKTGNRAEVYHVNLKNNDVSKAYELPHLPGLGAVSTSTDGLNVYFTRITEEEIILVDSTSHGVLGKKGDKFAVRSAITTTSDEWTLVRNGDVVWARPEGMSAAVAAAWAEIPETESLAKLLEEEAHTNPLSAYISRVTRHINDLQYLPDYLASLPSRFIGSILANHGKVLWSKKAVDLPKGQSWEVSGILVNEVEGLVEVVGSHGDVTVAKPDSGDIVNFTPPHAEAVFSHVARIESATGPRLLTVGVDGTIEGLLPGSTFNQTLVLRGAGGELKGIKLSPDGTTAKQTTSWVFTLRRYLNPNALLVAATDKTKSTLTTYVLDSVSGEVLSSASYEGVDATKPIDCVMSENWFACTFFGHYTVRDGTNRVIKGYQISVTDLYESEVSNDRGPLGDAAKRPVGRDPTKEEMEAEGLARYAPQLELDPRLIISHVRDVIGVKEILASPTIVESTSLILSYGIDVFASRVTPSLQFDVLGREFNKLALLGTVGALALAVMALKPMVRRKQTNQRWEAPS